MKLLLTNDDGLYAEGLTVLSQILAKGGHQIAVVAPDRERSASGHSITINDPLRAQEVSRGSLPANVICYKTNGTPADCVKLGLEKLINFKPDLIISGINNGPNLGFEILYSGTVSAAIEGWMMGYSSLAVSISFLPNRSFEKAALFIDNYLEKHLKEDLTNKVLLNINIPSQVNPQAKPNYTRLGQSLYSDSFEERVDPMGRSYYWLSGSNKEKHDPASDIAVYLNDEISITPLHIDLTDFNELKNLQNI